MIKNVTDKLPKIKALEGGTPTTTIVDGTVVTNIHGGKEVEKSQARPITLKYNGISKVLQVGESLDCIEFNVPRADVPLVEARFGQKFNGLIAVVDTKAEQAKIAEKDRAGKIKKVDAAKTIADVADLMKGENDAAVLDACTEKINALASGSKPKGGSKKSDYDDMSYAALMDLAKEKGIDATQQTGKAKLIKLLEDADK